MAASLSLHLAAIAAPDWPHPGKETPMPTPLQATLVPKPQAAPTLIAPESSAPAAGGDGGTRKLAAPATPKRPAAPAVDADPVTAASRQIARTLLYPPEAIARGLEGEAVVMLFLDAAGDAAAARLERSSGHAILDEAAVRAARQVRALPTGMAQEIVLPVRFRLR